jgi:hypothetical protein
VKTVTAKEGIVMRSHVTLVIASEGDKLSIDAVGLEDSPRVEDQPELCQKIAMVALSAIETALRQEKSDADISTSGELPSDSEDAGSAEVGQAESGVPANSEGTSGPKLRLAESSGSEDVGGA